MKKARLKEEPKVENKKVDNSFSIKKLLITIIIIIIVLIATYFLIDVIVKKYGNNDKANETTNTLNVRKENDINYADIKNIKNDSYYLFFDKSDDENNNQYDILINSLTSNNYTSKFYYIDLSKKENKDLLVKESQLKELDKIKVKDTTLILVEDKKIKNKYEGSEEILTYLTSFFMTEEETDGQALSSSEKKTSNKETDSNTEKAK